MKCKICGEKLFPGSRFCMSCGSPVNNSQINYGERVLKCESCGGSLDIGDKENILFCPFCGSKKMILESDNVKMRRIDNSRLMHKDDQLASVEKYRIENEYKMALAKHNADIKKSAERGENISFVFTMLILVIAFVGIIALAAYMKSQGL